MDGYYIQGVTPVPHPGYGIVISLHRDEDKSYLVSITDIPQCTCEDFRNMSNKTKKNMWIPCKHFYFLFTYFSKLDFQKDKFMHAPTYSYNEVMRMMELAGVVDLQ